MTIHTALEKIDVLTKEELKHCIQLTDIEMENYEKCIKNYSPYMLKQFGMPHYKSLAEQRQKFVDKLGLDFL